MKYAAPIAVAASSALLVAAQDASTCAAATVTVAPVPVEYPVYISTYIGSNTVININNIDITVNNAPTTIEILTTGTSTSYSTVTATVTAAAAPTATTVADPIILGISTNTLGKRQTAFSGYLASGAGVAGTCQDAQSYSLTEGSFFVAESALQFSANAGDTIVDFQAGADIGSITTTFGLNNGFVWDNAAFVGGAAIFCLSTEGTVRAILDGSTQADCTVITLTAILASSCAGLNSTSTSANSTASATASSISSSVSGIATASANATSSVSSVLSSVSSVASSVASSLSSVLSNATASSTTTSAAPTGSAVQLAFQLPTSDTKKRQADTTEYIMDDGTFTTNASLAAVYQLVGAQLYLGYTYFSTNPGVDAEPFVPISPEGSIYETFSESGGALSWTNSSFTLQGNNEAQFAVVSSTLYAAFSSLPAGATVVSLSAIPVTTSTSASASASTTSSAASTTSSAAATTAAASTSSGVALSTGAASSVASSISSELSSVGSTSPVATGNARREVVGDKAYQVQYEHVRHRA